MLGLGLGLTLGFTGPLTPATPWPPLAPDGSSALVAADFKNGIYLVGETATTLNAMFAANVNWGRYDPTDVVAGTGLRPPAGQITRPTFIGDALAAILVEGATFLLELEILAASANAFASVFIADDPDANILYDSRSSGASAGANRITDGNSSVAQPAALSVGVHKTCVTFIDGKIARSDDGAVIIEMPAALEWDPPVNISLTGCNRDAILISIIAYEPQADEDLPEMSAA